MDRRRRLLVACAAVVAIGALPAPAGATAIGVSAPQFESPGGTVPTIVTTYAVPPGYRVTISARGTNGAVATCTGSVWMNRIRRTASRKCYLRLPARPGAYNVRGQARLTRAGAPDVTRVGSGGRSVLANGYPTPGGMTLAKIAEIERCFNETDHVWLTFDDGGSPAQVRRILTTLRRNRVRARFFFTGAWAASNPSLLRQIRRNGHAVGNHSYTHPPLSKLSKAEVLGQIGNGTRPSSPPRLLRPPFAAGALTTRLESIAAARGYRLCRWTTDTYDWQGPSVALMTERVLHGDALTPPIAAGGTILMHGTGPHTSTGLQRIIDAVRSKHLTLEPLR